MAGRNQSQVHLTVGVSQGKQGIGLPHESVNPRGGCYFIVAQLHRGVFSSLPHTPLNECRAAVLGGSDGRWPPLARAFASSPTGPAVWRRRGCGAPGRLWAPLAAWG